MNSTNRFVDELLTPHPRRVEEQSDVIPSRLLESERLNKIKSGYCESTGSLDDQFEAGRAVAELVSESLWYETIAGATNEFGPINLSEKADTNCFGYTIVASECLEEVGIQHQIAFINGHSFIILCGEQDDRSRIFAVDALVVPLSGDITDAFAGKVPARTPDSDKKYTDSSINTAILVEIADIEPSCKEKFLRNNLWLVRDGAGGCGLSRMRVYGARDGRQMLVDYANMYIHTNAGRLERAMLTAQKLEGAYPDESFQTIDNLRGALGRGAVTSWGKEDLGLAGLVNSSLGESVSLHSFDMPDTMRRVGTESNLLYLLVFAKEYYQNIPTTPGTQLDGMKKQRLRAVSKQIEHIQGDK